MTPSIIEERPDSPDASALIDELESHLASLYPRESRHGYSIDKLLQEAVAFFVVRDEGVAAGCGGVQLYGEFGELKRMYIRPEFRGRGLGRLVLDRLTDHALGHEIGLLRLEPESTRRRRSGLYQAAGFKRIPPFGEYREDPLSVFMEKRIA